MESHEIKKRLEEIAAEIKSGQSPAKYKLEIDKLLNTELGERDEVAEAVYEAQRNNSDE